MIAEPVKPVVTDVFVGGVEGYNTYRIPSLILTPQGTLLAFAEARQVKADAGHVEMVMKRSMDHGKTWEPLKRIIADGPNRIGDPCPVYDNQTNTLILLHTHSLGVDTENAILSGKAKGERGVFVTTSTDQGATWSTPVNITKDVKDPNWTWYATGPGVAIQLEVGEHKGRIVVPANHALAGSKKYESHTFYSDDHGKTWKMGGITGVLGNESQVVELSDGSVMANMRSYRGKRLRAVSISKDGGQTFGDIADDSTLIEPVCQASLTRFTRDGKQGLLFCNPASKSRNNLTLRVSEDDGKTWPRDYCIEKGGSAYSCMAVLPETTVGVLYERGNYSHISFQRLPIP